MDLFILLNAHLHFTMRQKKISRRIAEESLEKETVGEEEMELGKGAEKPASRFQAYKKQMVYTARRRSSSATRHWCCS